MVLVFAMMVPAMAANATETDIVITNGATGSVYSAWRVLDAKANTNSDGTYDGTYKYSVNDKYLDDLKEVTGKTISSEIITYISKLTGAKTQTFADDLFEELRDKAPDATSTNSEFENMSQGYYLIAETTKANNLDTVSKECWIQKVKKKLKWKQKKAL